MKYQQLIEAFERLREAESMLGSPTSQLFMDDIDPSGRLEWLKSTRQILKANGIKPENLNGQWHT